MSNLKESLYNFCDAYCNNRIQRIQTTIADLQEALASETKSSAGDKHETGRAMLQLEREKLGRQLAEAEGTRQLLAGITIKNSSKEVRSGSLVHTSRANYFMAISAGEYKVDGMQVYCISPKTPMGLVLMGKSAGETIVYNGEEIKVLEVG